VRVDAAPASQRTPGHATPPRRHTLLPRTLRVREARDAFASDRLSNVCIEGHCSPRVMVVSMGVRVPLSTKLRLSNPTCTPCRVLLCRAAAGAPPT
jgi:hypothetical protein